MKKLRFILTIILPLIIFIYITFNVINHKTDSFDNYCYKEISKFISPNITHFMILISFFGLGHFLVAFSLILIIAFLKTEKTSFFTSMIIINLFISSIINTSFKYLIHRERPNIMRLVEIGGFSFPSGHSMVSMSFYGFLIFLCFKNYKTGWKYLIIALLSILILLIGLSRIYLGVHYASDVIGGFTLGILWLGILCFIINIKHNPK